MSGWMGLDPGNFPGWPADRFGNLTLTVDVGGEDIVFATVVCDDEAGLYSTYIGSPSSDHQIGRHDSNQARAVRKAEEFLVEKLKNLLQARLRNP